MLNYIGNWDKERSEIDIAIGLIYLTLLEITDINPKIAFDRLFPEIIFEVSPNVGGNYHEYVSALTPTTVKFDAGKVTYRLAIHGLGHVLILTDKENNPAEWLSKNVVRTTSGRAVTGAGRSGYSRSMGYHAPKYTGYYSIYYPFHQHPRDLDEKGNTPPEDFCDWWLSLVTKNIMDNDSGNALKLWMTNYILNRINYD